MVVRLFCASVLLVMMPGPFQAPPAYAGTLAWAGFDVMNLANNHVGDYGRGALLDTLRYVRRFGMTGVGAGEITAYTYWVVEKGYAAWAGPNDGSPVWVRRARGWIRVMKVDAWVAWVIYTISTAAFYMLGAAVLNPQGLVPASDEVLETISSIFSTAVGEWGAVVFLVGAGVAPSRRFSKGRVKKKVEPSPGSLSTPISPPISRTSCLLMARPRPVPP